MSESDKALEELRDNIRRQVAAARERRERAEFEMQLGVLLVVGIPTVVFCVVMFLKGWL